MTRDGQSSNTLYSNEDKSMMKLALQLAERGWKEHQEVPIGCVITHKGQVIAQSYNQKESLKMGTAHAEILAIEEASKTLNGWRLNDCRLYVTAEPCAMCAGAIIQARVGTVIYGCDEPKFGCAKSLYPLLTEGKHNHQPQVVGGLLAEECSKVLQDFFLHRRQSKF
ncbi:MAG: tRNA-specific adenosine deaminase [Bdellovibrionaceae bacterium]|nr:tRNA-specific adenosine deaminase [Pseudobdellovibrionaceae bacterium]